MAVCCKEEKERIWWDLREYEGKGMTGVKEKVFSWHQREVWVVLGSKCDLIIVLYKGSNIFPSLLKIPHWVPSSVISTCSFKSASLWQHIFVIPSTNTFFFLYLFLFCLLLQIYVKTLYHWPLGTLYFILLNFIVFLSLQRSKRSVMQFKNFRIQKLFHGTIRSLRLSYWNFSILPLKFN